MHLRELNWLAGLLEGEGSFLRPLPSSPRCPAIRVEMCDQDVVARVARLLERAVCPVEPRAAGYRRSYVTTIKGRPAIRLMIELVPLLSDVRRGQVTRALSRVGPRALPQPAWSPTVPWLAGLLEGEGTFTAREKPHSWVTLSVEMCDRQTIERAASMLGATGIFKDEGGLDRGWSPTYSAKISGNRARPWMIRLRPLMGRRRQEAIDRALDSWTPIRLWPAPTGCVVEGCIGLHRARGLCNTHYMRWSRYRAAGKDPGFKPLR